MVQRDADGGPFEALPLVRNENGTYEGMLFDVMRAGRVLTSIGRRRAVADATR